MADHHLVVTRVEVDDEDGTCVVDYDYEVECPGVEDSCRAWIECRTCSPGSRLEEDEIRHGVRHREFYGGWIGAETEQCLAHALDSNACDLAQYLAERSPQTAVGKYPIELDCDDGFVYVSLINDLE